MQRLLLLTLTYELKAKSVSLMSVQSLQALKGLSSRGLIRDLRQ